MLDSLIRNNVVHFTSVTQHLYRFCAQSVDRSWQPNVSFRAAPQTRDRALSDRQQSDLLPLLLINKRNSMSSKNIRECWNDLDRTKNLKCNLLWVDQSYLISVYHLCKYPIFNVFRRCIQPKVISRYFKSILIAERKFQKIWCIWKDSQVLKSHPF